MKVSEVIFELELLWIAAGSSPEIRKKVLSKFKFIFVTNSQILFSIYEVIHKPDGMQNELCKCFVHEIIKKVIFIRFLNRLKLKHYLHLFVNKS